MHNPILPAYHDCADAILDGKATALHYFIHDNEPADPEGEKEFREQLVKVLAEAKADASADRESEAKDLLRSACCIAERKGEGTAWERFIASVHKLGLSGVTARTYRVLPSDGWETTEADKPKS